MGIRSFLSGFSRITEATPGSASLSEAAPQLQGIAAYGYGIDSDDHLYRRLSQQERELPTVVQDRAIRLAWALYESNPLAHGIIEMIKDHVVGKGFNVQSANPDVQKVIDKHWKDHVNQWEIKQYDRIRDLSIFGELVLAVFVNEANGHVRLAGIDPAHIRGVYSDPENPEDITTIVVNPRRATAGFKGTDKLYRVIHKDEDPASDTFGYFIGKLPGEVFHPAGSSKSYPYTGSCFFFTINKIIGATRGRSDLLSVIDWLDTYDQILFNFADRTLLMNAFVWDVTLQGATKDQITNWMKEHAATPKPGTVNVHNESEKWEAVSPLLRNQEAETQQKTLKSQILAPTGMPPMWFGEDDSNKATAQEMSHPAMKRLTTRQVLAAYIISFIIQFQIDQAIIAGTLEKPKGKRSRDLKEAGEVEDVEVKKAGTQPNERRPGAGMGRSAVDDDDEEDEYKFQVSVSEMSSKDLTQASNSLMNVAQSLVIAMTAGIIDMVEAQRIFANMSAELGVDINIDAMVKRLEEEGIEGFQGDGSIDKIHPGDEEADAEGSTGASPENHTALARNSGPRQAQGNNRPNQRVRAGTVKESSGDRAVAALSIMARFRDLTK